MLEAGQVEEFLNVFLAADEDAYSDIYIEYDGSESRFIEDQYGSPMNALRGVEFWRGEHSDEPYFNIDGVQLHVKEEEGGDGEGSELTAILEVTRNGKHVAHIRLQTYYSSYEITQWEFEGCQLVEPRQVMVTKYFALDGSDDE